MAGSRGCRRSGCAKRGRGTSETFLPSQVHTIGIKIAGERVNYGPALVGRCRKARVGSVDLIFY